MFITPLRHSKFVVKHGHNTTTHHKLFYMKDMFYGVSNLVVKLYLQRKNDPKKLHDSYNHIFFSVVVFIKPGHLVILDKIVID